VYDLSSLALSLTTSGMLLARTLYQIYIIIININNASGLLSRNMSVKAIVRQNSDKVMPLDGRFGPMMPSKIHNNPPDFLAHSRAAAIWRHA